MKEYFIKSLPVATGYLTLGLTYGILFQAKGGSPFEALLIATFCFAGAAQFIALEFYKADYSWTFLFITIFTLNLRHIFYVLNKIGFFQKNWKRTYLLMALTDENYGMMSFYDEVNFTNNEWFKVFALNHFYWILGCVAGSMAPATVIEMSKGAEFSLIALFIVIFAANMKRKKI